MRVLVGAVRAGHPPRAIAIKAAEEAPGERKAALVIGNAAYRVTPLKNAVHDAQDMASALRDCGFKVRLVLDADREGMFKAVREFGHLEGGEGEFQAEPGGDDQVAGSPGRASRRRFILNWGCPHSKAPCGFATPGERTGLLARWGRPSRSWMTPHSSQIP
ncbi:caspase family protein [Geothrix sp. 21YS21S-2]|uniref:caspase family protein n=1 Tax=Geothrix sp. 21YS21S-2 TaxID=3068893 RepID=UPI00358F376F